MSELPSSTANGSDEGEVARRRPLRVIGVSLALIGLLLVLAGIGLGILEYNSPLESTTRRAAAILEDSVKSGEVEGEEGVTISDVQVPELPGPAHYVVAQPVTWIGILVVFAGVVVLIRAMPGAASDDQNPLSPVTPTGGSSRPASDDPFDLED